MPQPQQPPSLWVFGYGSLCWHPGFEFDRSMIGRVDGFARKFWQGNTTHRGTPNRPGRVATLVEEKDGVVWGRAFLLKGENALPYLDRRECQLGGYTTRLAKFHPIDPDESQSVDALLYLATPSNLHWLGDAPDPEIAAQILTSSGPTGHNVEYLLRLAEFMRDEIPEAEDDHLFGLERLVRQGIAERNLSIGQLMGEGTNRIAERAGHAHLRQPPANRGTNNTDQYSARVPSKKLRCLGI